MYNISSPEHLAGDPQDIIDQISNLYEDALDLEKSKRRVSRLRDLTLVDLVGGINVVIACDSNAGIGEKPDDSIKKPYTEQGISILKVPLIEIIASGAAPVLVVNNLCFEMEPYGKTIIKVMKDELDRNGFDSSVQITGSTEDNAKTYQTGSGLTILGLGHKSQLRLGNTKIGDTVCVVGNPKDGGVLQYSEFDRDVLSIADTISLTKLPYIHEILPCGSHGCLYEAAALASDVGGSFDIFDSKFTISLNTSAGSCTAALVSLDKCDIDRLKSDMDIMITPIGTVREAIL